MSELLEHVYAQADFERETESFRIAMDNVIWRTSKFPHSRSVYMQSCDRAHDFVYMKEGSARWTSVSKGLGPKAWIAEWMRCNAGKRPYYQDIAFDAAVTAANALTTQLALPVGCAFEVAVSDGGWFDWQRGPSIDVVNGTFAACEEIGMACTAGSPAWWPHAPNASPFFSVSATGVIAPETRRIKSESLRHGTEILGVASSGIHVGGISFLIQKAAGLPEGWLTPVPDSTTHMRTLGDEALVPSCSYAALVDAMVVEQICLHGLVASGDGGLSQIAFDNRPFSYWIDYWPEEISPLFWFLLDMGVPLAECLANVNWGIGYYIFAPKGSVDAIMRISRRLRLKTYHLGCVLEGERSVVFNPKGEYGDEPIVLRP